MGPPTAPRDYPPPPCKNERMMRDIDIGVVFTVFLIAALSLSLRFLFLRQLPPAALAAALASAFAGAAPASAAAAAARAARSSASAASAAASTSSTVATAAAAALSPPSLSPSVSFPTRQLASKAPALTQAW